MDMQVTTWNRHTNVAALNRLTEHKTKYSNSNKQTIKVNTQIRFKAEYRTPSYKDSNIIMDSYNGRVDECSYLTHY